MASGKGLYTLDEDLIRSLHPTVILTQALCTVCAIDASLVHRLARWLTFLLPPYTLKNY